MNTGRLAHSPKGPVQGGDAKGRGDTELRGHQTVSPDRAVGEEWGQPALGRKEGPGWALLTPLPTADSPGFPSHVTEAFLSES